MMRYLCGLDQLSDAGMKLNLLCMVVSYLKGTLANGVDQDQTPQSIRLINAVFAV